MTGGSAGVRRHAPVLATLLGIVAVDVGGGRNFVVLGVLAVVPFVAANLLGPRTTAMYALATIVAAALVGVYDGQFEVPTLRRAQLMRMAVMAAAGAAGVLAAVRREQREARLQQVVLVAEAAQRAILAPVPPVVGGVRCAVQYDSAAEEATVGGDVYAAVDSPFGARLLVADVRGKGLDAVRLASFVLGAFRERAGERSDLGVLMADLDAAVRRGTDEQDDSEDFVTAVLAQLDPNGGLVLVNAGHPAPLLVRDGSARFLQSMEPSPPLGLHAVPRLEHVQLQPADRLLLYTDGLTEARHAERRTFFDLLAAAPGTLGSGSLEEGLDRLRTAVVRWTDGNLSDDVAMLAAEVPQTAS